MTAAGQSNGERGGMRIVVGVDGSEGSRRALRWALREAAAWGGTVQATMAWKSLYDSLDDDTQLPPGEVAVAEAARTRLAEAIASVRDAAPGVPVEAVLVEGEPTETLCRRSREADLLVVGSRGRRSLGRWVLGSVSTACAHHAHCPLVIVPEEGDATG